MFDDSNCNECENIDCLTRCQWIDFDNVEEAREEMFKMIKGEDSRVLSECVTCFACDEMCREYAYDSHPFDLFVNLQEKYKSHEIPPRLIKTMVAQYKPHEELRIKDINPEEPVLNKCAFVKSHAKHMEGQLFEDLQYVAGRDYFCNLMYHHIERDSVIRERVPKIIENIEKQNIKEMICFHDECYGLYASYCPRNNIDVPFEPIHIFEYLYNYLQENEDKIQKLNMKVAYQRNCSNRFIGETDKYVDKILDLIGVKRVSRDFDRQNALCCGGPFPMLGRKDILRKTQNKNIKDMLEHDAEACVYNCPMCMETLGSKVERKGLKNYLLIDLCRLALGEDIE